MDLSDFRFDDFKLDADNAVLVSFSGGRTSGYMLRLILDAYGGELPEHVHVAFANTGKERPETLDFVQRVSTEWAVPINWVEYAADEPGKTRVVNHNSARRNGEPYDELIQSKQFLPNIVTSYCTQELKIRRQAWLMRRILGYDRWVSVIGYRADEAGRVAGAARRNLSKKDRWFTIAPLAAAGVFRADVMRFWARQPFDLGLASYEGNCDLCFKKGHGKLVRLMAERPDLAAWWIDKENWNNADGPMGRGRAFSKRFSYAELLRFAQAQGVLPEIMEGEADALDCFCTD